MNRLGCLTLGIAIFLVLSFPFLFYGALETALGKLGIPPDLALLIFVGMLIGSGINIPLFKVPSQHIVRVDPLAVLGLSGFLPHLAQMRTHTVIAVNVGGCVIPTALAAYQVLGAFRSPNPHGTLIAMFLAVAVNVVVCWKLARPVPGIGVVMPGLVPALVAAATALFLAADFAPPVAYVAGVLGPLIGADLLHLKDIKAKAIGMASIGGAGTFDGIVLSGVMAAILA